MAEQDLDVGMRCIKYMLFLSNFMFMMIGFLLVSIGTTVKAIYETFEIFMASHYFSPAALCVAIGIIIFFVALFGCVGAIRESTLLINLFAICMAFILLLEFSAAVASYAMRNQIQQSIRLRMEDTMPGYYDVSYIKRGWNIIQTDLHCCGVDSFKDWETDSTTKTPTPSLLPDLVKWSGPESCCRFESSCHREEIYKRGCLSVLTSIVSESALLLGCGALAVAFIQLLGVFFAIMLAKAVRRLKSAVVVEREIHRQEFYKELSKQKVENPTPVLYTNHNAASYSEC